MNIKINKRLVSILLAGTMSFTLTGCLKDEEISTDSFSLDEVVDEVEEDSYIDEVLEEETITLENPVNGEIRNLNLDDASNYLERIIELGKKLDEMGIEQIGEEDPASFLAEESATWTIEDAYDFIDDIYYADEEVKMIAIKRLSYYKDFLDKELRTNGINIAIRLLENSIKTRLVDNESDYSDLNNIYFEGNKLIYNDEVLSSDDDTLSLLDNLKNISENSDSFDNTMGYSEVVSLLDNSLNTSKNIIYNGLEKSDNKIKIK